MRAAAVVKAIDFVRRATAGDRSDADLLDRFVAVRDEEAFAELVRRHGPKVYAVCRRVLDRHDAAEDAFQATFLVLARKAGTVHPRSAVGGFLYGVARKAALEALAVCRRRKELLVGRAPDEPAPARSPPDADVLALLDEEVANLSEPLRAAVVLCELDGVGRADAARQLGVPAGTLSSRLAAARKQLAARLKARGVVFSATWFAALAPAASAVAPVLAAPSQSVSTIAKGVLKTMLLAKLRTASVLAALALTLSAWALAPASPLPAGVPAPAPVRIAPVPAEAPEVKTKKLEELWGLLLVSDEVSSTRALLELTARPKADVVAFLDGKLKTLKLSADRARKLLADLGSEKRDVAIAAFEELNTLDPRLVLTVAEVLTGLPDGTHRQRVVAVLLNQPLDAYEGCSLVYESAADVSAKLGREFPGQIQMDELPNRPAGANPIFKGSTAVSETVAELARWRWHKDWGRATRAVMLLEHIGTPEAVKVLERMASGHEDASPTKAAKDALKRLNGR